MIAKVLCRLGLHNWATVIGNYPGEDRWWRERRCIYCNKVVEE